VYRAGSVDDPSGDLDVLPDKELRKNGTIYYCPSCSRVFIVYRGEVTCSCEEINRSKGKRT